MLADPCGATLDGIDVSRWCPGDRDPGSATVIDPGTGKAIQMPDYQECSGASERWGDVVAAICGNDGYESYLVTVDPATGRVLAATSRGRAPVSAPLIVAGTLFLNSYTTEGDSVLMGSDGNGPEVGGASIAGLGVVGDRLLVQTESDRFGGTSTYGKSLGLWSPTTGDFTKVYTL